MKWKQSREQKSVHEASVNMTGEYSETSCNQVSWIVDSGATNHITGDKDLLLHDGKVGSAGNVQLPTGESAKISHIGKYPLSGGDVLKNVLCVPTFKFNLLSVSKVTKDLNCCAKFHPEYCVFHDLCTGKVKVTGRVQDDLYILNTQYTGNNHMKRSAWLFIVKVIHRFGIKNWVMYLWQF